MIRCLGSLIFLFFSVAAPVALAGGLAKDDYFHFSLHIGERIEPTSYRIGYQGFEVGKLNNTTLGVVYRWGAGWMTCGFGVAHGSSGFSDAEPGLYGEVGMHYLVSDWFDFRVDSTSFIGVGRNIRSELLVGVGFHI